jgi:addiction module HigA family antidote
MLKTPPIHAGKAIDKAILEQKRTIKEVAETMGISRQQMRNIMIGNCGIMPKMAERLAQALGGTAKSWLRIQSDYERYIERKHKQAIKDRPHFEAIYGKGNVSIYENI